MVHHKYVILFFFLQVATRSSLQPSEEVLGPTEKKKRSTLKKLPKAAFSYIVDIFSLFLKILFVLITTGNFTTYTGLLFLYITKTA